MTDLRFSFRLALGDDPPASLLSRAQLEAVSERIERIHADIETKRGSGTLAFLDLPYAYDEPRSECLGSLLGKRAEIIELAKRVRASGGQFVHIGIGGSALGAITLIEALGDPSDIHVTDNVDPDGIAPLLDRLDPDRVYANVVSKSGGTVESIATFAVLTEFLRDVPESTLQERLFATTNPERGALLELARAEGYQILPLPDEVHGRFSVLSPMGLFTAAIAGVDVDALLQGARAADEHAARAPFWENPAQLLAALHFVGDTENGLSNLILLPYSHRLRFIGDWYSQLVAESLGKNGIGVTPVKALGVTDQHSQLQLYNDGPKDKLVVFFGVREPERDLRIPESIASHEDYAFLAGHSLQDLLRAEMQATQVSLHLNAVPSCIFDLPRLDAFHLGALLVVLQRTVCILGDLYGVDAFNQPGVEESKEYARAMLGRKGERYDRLRETVARLSGAD